MSKVVSFYSLSQGRRMALKQAVEKIDMAASRVGDGVISMTISATGKNVLIPNVGAVLRHKPSSKIITVPMGKFGEVNDLGFIYDAKLLDTFHNRLLDGPMYGENGSPTERTLDRVNKVDIHNVSHEVLDAANVDGQFVLYIAPGEELAKQLQGSHIATSMSVSTMKFGMRGNAKIRAGGDKPVADVFDIVTWDYLGVK